MTSARVTIRDVAHQAGVSPTTVSHVLSGQGRVHADTRLRVERAVRELGYRANPLASNLRRDRFGAVGLYLPEASLSLQFYIDLALAASRVMFDRGGGLTLLPAVREPADLLALPLDGVIVAEPVVGDPVLTALVKAGMPLVLCEAAERPRGPKVHVIDNQHKVIMSELLDHLTAQGARKIAILAPDESVWWSVLLHKAVLSWQAGSGRNLRWATMPFLACTPEEARAAIDRVLDVAVPDALVIGQQGLGTAAVAAATARGLTVPGDLMIASCVDGADLLTTAPSITAIDLRPSECGQLAARLLLDGSTARRVRLAPRLIIRASTTRLSTAAAQ